MGNGYANKLKDWKSFESGWDRLSFCFLYEGLIVFCYRPINAIASKFIFCNKFLWPFSVLLFQMVLRLAYGTWNELLCVCVMTETNNNYWTEQSSLLHGYSSLLLSILSSLDSFVYFCCCFFFFCSAAVYINKIILKRTVKQAQTL